MCNRVLTWCKCIIQCIAGKCWLFDYLAVGFCPETVFLNFYEAQESISRNQFRQPMYPGGLVYDNPIPTRFLALIDCSKIPAETSWQNMEEPEDWELCNVVFALIADTNENRMYLCLVSRVQKRKVTIGFILCLFLLSLHFSQDHIFRCHSVTLFLSFFYLVCCHSFFAYHHKGNI
jgi:hypothetical protein